MYKLKQQNYEFGFNNENIILNKLKKLGDIETFDRYYTYDFRMNICNMDCLIELKSRNISSSKYPDTMIGLNKLKNEIIDIEHKKNPEIRVMLIFKFSDKTLMKILRYNKIDEFIAKCKVKDFTSIYNKSSTAPYLYIPIALLDTWHFLND